MLHYLPTLVIPPELEVGCYPFLKMVIPVQIQIFMVPKMVITAISIYILLVDK